MRTDASRRWLLLALGIGALLRLGLIAQGGQFYFGDEGRFLRSVLLYRSLLDGDSALAAKAVASPIHAGFTYAGALIAAPVHLAARGMGLGDWTQAVQVRTAAPLFAAALGLFSVLNIALLHRLVRTAGGDEAEAGLAALLSAVAASLTYYARHLLPYDLALTAALIGLILAAGPPGRARTLLAGAAGGLTFTLYNGYWFLVPVIGLATVLPAPDWPGRFRAAGLSCLGAVSAIGLVMLPGLWCAGADYGREFLAFSGTVTQGLFAEGWLLPFAYLGAAEGLLGTAAIAGILWSLRPGQPKPHRLRLWVGLAAAIYLLLAVCSTGLEKFVVYGRSVRPLTMLGCLLAGYAAAQLWRRWPRVRLLLIGTILALGVANLIPHYRLGFPAAVKEQVWSMHGIPKLGLSFSGVSLTETWPPVTRPDLLLLNPVGLFPLRTHLPEPAGEVLAAWPHPHALAAYQFEGHSPRERRLLQAHPPAIRLIRLAQPAGVPDQPPPELQLLRGELPDGYDRTR